MSSFSQSKKTKTPIPPTLARRPNPVVGVENSVVAAQLPQQSPEQARHSIHDVIEGVWWTGAKEEHELLDVLADQPAVLNHLYALGELDVLFDTIDNDDAEQELYQHVVATKHAGIIDAYESGLGYLSALKAASAFGNGLWDGVARTVTELTSAVAGEVPSFDLTSNWRQLLDLDVTNTLMTLGADVWRKWTAPDRQERWYNRGDLIGSALTWTTTGFTAGAAVFALGKLLLRTFRTLKTGTNAVSRGAKKNGDLGDKARVTAAIAAQAALAATELHAYGVVDLRRFVPPPGIKMSPKTWQEAVAIAAVPILRTRGEDGAVVRMGTKLRTKHAQDGNDGWSRGVDAMEDFMHDSFVRGGPV